MKLAILIPTLNEPWNVTMLKRLRNILDPQIERFPGQVEIVMNDAGRLMVIGEKRNQMIKNTESEYFCFIDDDDYVSSYYVDSIMKALTQNPDVVTFNGWYVENNKSRKPFEIKLGHLYQDFPNKFLRWPNHITVMRRACVEHVRFPMVRNGEDYQWSKEINDRKLLKTSVHIEQDLYTYDFIPHHLRNVAHTVR